jgi:hypothetical protein
LTSAMDNATVCSQAEFYVRPVVRYLPAVSLILLAADLVLIQRRDWSYYATAGFLVLAAAYFVWYQRKPVFALFPWGLRIAPDMLSRTIELRFDDIRAWVHSTRQVAFLTSDGKRVYARFNVLSADDRMRLLELLGRVLFAVGDSSELTAAHLERRERRFLFLVGFVTLVVLVLGFLVAPLHF